MMSKDKIKELVKDIYTSLKHFKEKYEKSYEVLQTTQEEGIAKIEETKKGRASKFSSEVDKQIKALRIVIKREYDKHVELLKKTDETLKYIEELTNYTKKPDTSVISIQEKLENLIPLLAQIYKDSDYIIGRLRVSTGYTLATQKELVEAGLSYNPVKKLLESEISNIAPGLDMPNTSMGAFNIARGKSTIGSTEGLGGQVATLKERQKQGWKGDTVLDKIRRNKNKEEITNFLTSATPESLSSMPTAMKKKISGYMGGREIGRLAAIEKGDIHQESSTEKLILEKTGKTREELLSGNFGFPAPAKPIGGGAGGGIGGGGGNKGGASSPMEASQKALVAYTGPGQTSGSDFDYLQEYANKLKNEKLQSSSTSSIEKATNKGVQKKTRAKKESGKVVSLGGGAGGTGGTGGGGGGGTGGGGGGTGGARGIVDVRLVDITTSAIKQLDDLLVKVLGSSPIGNGGGGGGTGDMATLAQELKLSRESNEKIAKMYEARREKAVEEFKKKNAEKKAKKEKLDDPNSEESIAKAIRAKKRKERDAETIRKADPNSLESLAEKAREEQRLQSNLETIRKADPNSPESLANKIREEQRLQSNLETIRKSAPDSPESIAKNIKAAQAAQSAAETIRKSDPNSPESLAKKIREEKRLQRDLETIRKADPNSPENIAKAAAEEEKRKKKEEKDEKKKLNVARQADPFRKRLQTIFKEGEQELSFLYAKLDSYVGWIKPFNSAILKARGSALETLRKGYEKFDEEYASSGSAFKGMKESIKAMYSISPFTVIVAGLTTIGVLLGKTIFNAAQKLNTQIKEISAELGTSNRQSYEMFKNAMNAQTQFENLHASLRDVMDAQKGILGDSGILLRTNDKALSAIADNAKNIGLSVESAGAFYENLRMKGAGDIEANNVMTASLELADKRGFSPQSIVDDIAQNAEFASKYFSKINKDSKSAHRNLIETNIQVKNLGLNFQKAAKMTQHLLSFEQSITAEVEASVALGTHVDIGKARELLLQDDIAGAMTQMMNAIPGGYEGFQNMDFAERQLSANALGLEVSELERSLYLREKIKLSNSEDLELAMKHDDYLKKIAGTNDELYRTELNKVQAAERYNTSIEKLSVSFRYALAPVLEAVVPVVDLLAGAINKLANIVKSFVGGITGANSDAAIGGGGIKTPDMYQMGGGALMATVMGGQLLKMMKGPVGGKIGEVVAKARGGLDTLRGTLGTKTNPMYVVSLNDGAGGGGFDGGGSFVKGKYRSQAVLDRAQRIRNIRNANSPKPGLLKGFENNIKNLKAGNLIKDVIKTGGVTAAIFAGLDLYNRKQSGQSTAQAASGSISGLLGGLGGAAIGAAIGTFLLPGIGTILGGLIGGYYGQSATSTISDSHFDKNKSSSFTGGYGIYAGMGLNTAGSIVANNKPKATGTPVETSMVDMTPTTFKSPTNSLANISPNYGMTSSIARESVMVNRSSKSVATTAMMQKTIKDKEKTDDALIKEAQEQTKLMHEMIKRLNQPSLAFFNEEGRRQTANYVRVKSTP